MMRNNVKANYGDGNYPGLSLHAKTGTAEVGRGKSPHSWFVGFSGDYAFAVCLENSGYGATAGRTRRESGPAGDGKGGVFGQGVEMLQIRPITDLRKTTEISELCHAKKEPIFITKNGYGDLVVLRVETYEEMLETAAMDTAISEAEKEFAAEGTLLDARETLSALRR